MTLTIGHIRIDRVDGEFIRLTMSSVYEDAEDVEVVGDNIPDALVNLLQTVESLQ